MTTITEIRDMYPNMCLYSAGGGDIGLLHPCDGGGEIIITNTDGEFPAESETVLACGRYTTEGEPVQMDTVHIDELETWIDAALRAGRGK